MIVPTPVMMHILVMGVVSEGSEWHTSPAEGSEACDLHDQIEWEIVAIGPFLFPGSMKPSTIEAMRMIDAKNQVGSCLLKESEALNDEVWSCIAGVGKVTSKPSMEERSSCVGVRVARVCCGVMRIPLMGTAKRIVSPRRGEVTYFATTEQRSAPRTVSWTRIHIYKTTKYLHWEKHKVCVRACASGMMEVFVEKRIEYIRDGCTANAHSDIER